jgi:hypothetical protein
MPGYLRLIAAGAADVNAALQVHDAILFLFVGLYLDDLQTERPEVVAYIMLRG